MGTPEEKKTKRVRLVKRLNPTSLKKTQAELEAQLTPKQRAIWLGLKQAITDVKNGTSEPMTWEDFKKELADEGYSSQGV
jgi:hypothetical protein